MIFETVKFSDITVNHDKKRIPLSTMERSKRQGPYRYYGAQGVIDYIDDYIFDGKYLLIAEDGENLKSKKQNIAQLAEGRFWVNNHAHIVQCNERCRLEYLCFMLNSMDLSGYITGSAQPKLSQANMNNISFEIPSVDMQDLILSVILPIEKRIAMNTAINENLEQQAQALYRQMFVNADDNQSATIADISLNITDGVHNTVKDDPDGSYLLLSCKNIKGGSLNIGSSERHINKETFDKLRKRTQLAKGDILISSVGTIGEILMLNTEPTYYEFQRSVAMIKPDTELVSPAYVYESLLYKKAELINAAHGAVQQCLFISDISEFPIDIPSKVKLDIFNTAVIPMFEIITANNEENQRLAALRDTLLPKLMNGEIDVSAVQI